MKTRTLLTLVAQLWGAHEAKHPHPVPLQVVATVDPEAEAKALARHLQEIAF